MSSFIQIDTTPPFPGSTRLNPSSVPLQDCPIEQHHGHLTKILRMVSIGFVLALTAHVATAQTAPSGSGPDPSFPVVATTSIGTTSGTTYLLNQDESVYYLAGSTIGNQAGCPALDTNPFEPGNGSAQAILYDPTANRLYIQSPLTD